MKKYFALLLFALIAIASYGQSNYQDVVYLKNGSIIRGVIIEQIPNKSIKIETEGRNVYAYQMEEIEKLAKEPYPGRRNRTYQGVLQEGYKGIVELGYEIGADRYSLNRLKLNIINGYQLNPYFSLGLGTGVRYYFETGTALIPLFADFRGNFMDNNISPYLSLGVGYSFNASRYFDGVGFLLNPTAGVSFRIPGNSVMNVGIGYEMQRMELYIVEWNYAMRGWRNTGAISINVGISF